MPKVINYSLTTEELEQVRNVLGSHKEGRVRIRAQIIYLLHLGKKPAEVAQIVDMSVATVYYWHQRWRTEGLTGLEERSRSGRERKGGQTFLEKLDETLQVSPTDLGYGFSVWTQERLIAHMYRETGVLVSEGTMYSRIRELGYVYRRPKHDLGNLQDQDVKKAADAFIVELKKKPKLAKSTFSLWMKQPLDC